MGRDPESHLRSVLSTFRPRARPKGWYVVPYLRPNLGVSPGPRGLFIPAESMTESLEVASGFSIQTWLWTCKSRRWSGQGSMDTTSVFTFTASHLIFLHYRGCLILMLMTLIFDEMVTLEKWRYLSNPVLSGGDPLMPGSCHQPVNPRGPLFLSLTWPRCESAFFPIVHLRQDQRIFRKRCKKGTKGQTVFRT